MCRWCPEQSPQSGDNPLGDRAAPHHRDGRNTSCGAPGPRSAHVRFQGLVGEGKGVGFGLGLNCFLLIIARRRSDLLPGTNLQLVWPSVVATVSPTWLRQGGGAKANCTSGRDRGETGKEQRGSQQAARGKPRVSQ